MTTINQSSRRITVVLWTLQALLAALFLFAGGMKFVMPIAEMTKQMPLPGFLIRFIGVAEVAGALGLILPGLFRIRPELTPLAARGLVIIMSGATALMLQGGVAPAVVPFVVGIVAGFIAYGRTQLAPQASSPRRAATRSAPLPSLATHNG